jgi:hypothetical protein
LALYVTDFQATRRTARLAGGTPNTIALARWHCHALSIQVKDLGGTHVVAERAGAAARTFDADLRHGSPYDTTKGFSLMLDQQLKRHLTDGVR